jgi:chromosomal replication initiator protein
MEERSEEKFDDEVIEYIAENFTDNVRELEGALNRVIMWAKMYNKKPDLQMAKDALNIFLANKKTEPSSNYDNLLSVIASMYSISVADILGSSRKANIVLPRQIAMYILRTRYELTYSKIGNILNGLDHSTVVNGFNKIEAEIKTNNQLELAIEAIMKKV